MSEALSAHLLLFARLAIAERFTMQADPRPTKSGPADWCILLSSTALEKVTSFWNLITSKTETPISTMQPLNFLTGRRGQLYSILIKLHRSAAAPDSGHT